MLLLDITVVNVALPDIQRSLHSSFSDLQWVVDAYSLTLAAFLLTAGVVGDIYGRRKVFAVGLVVFSASSLVCGLSTTPLMLNLARAVQGVGGAIMFATSLALIAAAFKGKDRGTAFGIYGAVIGGAVAIGPLVGGAITSGIGWRWIFFVNVPIGVVAIFITLTKIAESKDPRHRRIDWVGFVTFSLSLFALVFALVRGNDHGWGSTTIVGLLAASAVLMVVFFVNEHARGDPMLDLGLFRIPAFVGVSVVAFAIAASIFAMFLYLTLYIQDDLGYGPLAGRGPLPPPHAAGLRRRLLRRAPDRARAVALPAGRRACCSIAGRAAADEHDPSRLDLDRAAARVHRVPASASASSTRSWPRRPSRWSSPSAAAWPRAPTTRSARWASPPASPCSAPSSRARSSSHTIDRAAQDRRRPAVLHRGGAQLAGGHVGRRGAPGARDASPSPGARQTLLHAYHVGFSTTLNHLMIIGAIVAFVGALGGFALVRQRDFVVRHRGAQPAPAGGRTRRRHRDAGVPAVHA